MFGLPIEPSQVENMAHNLFMFIGGLAVARGYVSGDQLVTIGGVADTLIVMGLNSFTHARALASVPAAKPGAALAAAQSAAFAPKV